MVKDEQLEVTNELLLDMVKNQRENAKHTFKLFILIICCYTLLLLTMIAGFFVYELQYETTKTITTTETVTQEVSGTDSTINNVEGNQYNDSATHNE